MKLKITEKQKNRIKKLINALRSGKYIKTIGKMKEGDRFCFYGLACEIYRINTKNGSNWTLGGAEKWEYGGYEHFNDGIESKWTGPTKKVDDYYGWVDWRTEIEPGTKNDEGWSFKRLANLLERAIS